MIEIRITGPSDFNLKARHLSIIHLPSHEFNQKKHQNKSNNHLAITSLKFLFSGNYNPLMISLAYLGTGLILYQMAVEFPKELILQS